jgi:hypothetical protein
MRLITFTYFFGFKWLDEIVYIPVCNQKWWLIWRLWIREWLLAMDSGIQWLEHSYPWPESGKQIFIQMNQKNSLIFNNTEVPFSYFKHSKIVLIKTSYFMNGFDVSILWLLITTTGFCGHFLVLYSALNRGAWNRSRVTMSGTSQLYRSLGKYFNIMAILVIST